MAVERKPPPRGYVRHELDPNLIRKIAPPPSVAQAMYPYLRSAQEHSAQEAEKQKDWLAKKEKGR
jgi:hypothetical protein